MKKHLRVCRLLKARGQLVIAGGGSLAEPATGIAALLTALRTPGAKRAVASALDDPAFKKIAPAIGEVIEEAPLERIGGAYRSSITEQSKRKQNSKEVSV